MTEDSKISQILKIKLIGGEAKETCDGFKITYDNGLECFVSNSQETNPIIDNILKFQGEFEPEFTDEQLLIQAKTTKDAEVDNLYDKAQYINIINGHSFILPLRGEFFKVDIKKQHDFAQTYGSATLIAIDTNGTPQVIPNIPKEKWGDFYVIANTISESNYALKLQYKYNIKQAQTMETLEEIEIIFPEIQIYHLGEL